MSKVWHVLPRKYPDITKQILYNRGITSEKEIQEFLHPSLQNYQKELSVPGIEKAWKRLEKAIKDHEQIVIYGDYDVDGICASAIAYKSLVALGAKVHPFIPHREKDGYGLSKSGLDVAKEKGAALVLTVDNGIVALEQAQYAKSLGIDLIITDHHIPLETLPEAKAIVHSIQMCGSGVAWCLFKDKISTDLAHELLQFVAIGTIADLMPLVGVNRAFAVQGLQVLNQTTNPGISALIFESGLVKGNLGTYDISHILGPRLNAIGRLSDAIEALRLVCTDSPLRARQLAKLLSDTNSTRQQMTADALNQVKMLIGENRKKKIHIVDSQDWVPGIIGLIAGKVSEEYQRPAIAISVGETIAKGSARSVGEVNIVEVIRQCKDILVDVGGHKGAAGFSIENDKITLFKERMEKLMDSLPDDVQQTVEVDAEIESKQIKRQLIDEIETLSPFGFGNSQPIFVTKRMKIGDIRGVGEGKHLKFKADGLDAIAFGMGSLLSVLQEGQLVNLAFSLELNRFNGQEIVQLKVKDLQFD